ncbi:hypothetical protein [Mycoplasma sp. 1654_15]|uniref:hypothetical protein n=1 Tax=Mycoplasma sp. 1654_15 TaxID=2725994 RepID=UPI001449EE69|nr:hypothetical protein [Mycoplasma sp. 1654_15]QJB70932.1 hypothetical protein HF996_00105 [Mycoplasma sp. 1654_15]
MNPIKEQLLEYIDQKQARLTRNKILAFQFSRLIKYISLFASLTIVVLAAVVIYLELIRYNKIPVATRKSFFDELGLTIVLATTIVLTFVLNIFLGVYKEIMKYHDYKKAQRELNYIYLKIESDPNYSYETFESDFKEINDFYLAKKDVSKLKLLKKAILGVKK